MYLKKTDYEVWEAIQNETKRQCENLELIASENFVSEAVLQAQGSVLTNKYAEGYPDKRYYGGCEFVDIVEKLAIERAKKLFNCEHVNVQPHSGTQANMSVYFAVLNIGDTIMGMHLSHGGHLSHGHPINFSGKYFKTVAISVSKKTGRIDYKEARYLAKKHKPRLIVAGTSAYSRIIDWRKFRSICDEVGAYLMADIAHYAGLVSAGLYPSPVKYADFVTTTTHKTLRGPRGGMIMCKAKFATQIDKAVFPGFQGGPHENNIAAKAVAFKEALEPNFVEYAKQIKVNAKVLEKKFNDNGYKLMFGGTDNHLLLIDVTQKGLSGKEAQIALDKAGITVNKNMIPDDTRSPMDPSGIRLGTPALTTRGMKEEEMKQIANWIDRAIINHADDAKLANIRDEVKAMS